MALDLAHRLLALRFNMIYTPVPIIPEFIDILKILYTTEEAWLVGLMPPGFASAKTIARLQRKDPGRGDPGRPWHSVRHLLPSFLTHALSRLKGLVPPTPTPPAYARRRDRVKQRRQPMQAALIASSDRADLRTPL